MLTFSLSDGRNNTKKKRMNELMEFLRSRSKAGASGRSRTWNEAAKVLRMSMTVSTCSTENEKFHLQRWCFKRQSVLVTCFSIEKQKLKIHQAGKAMTSLENYKLEICLERTNPDLDNHV